MVSLRSGKLATSATPKHTYIIYDQSAVIWRSRLRNNADVQRGRFAAIPVGHALRRPEISSVDGSVEAAVEIHPYVHLTRFACRRDLGGELCVD